MILIKTNSTGRINLREMELTDMVSLMNLKHAEGWNQTEHDWALLINYNESVNLVAVLDDRIIGTVTAINYANQVAWIGMMLVDKEHRGRGISKLLFNEAIQKLIKCTAIKLDATPEGRAVYLKIGFRDEYTLYRMTHLSAPEISLNDRSVEIVQMIPEDLPEVTKFDLKVFGADRTELITHLYVDNPELAWIIRENNKVAGFSLGRRGENFTQIGPVYALSEKGAKALIGSALNQMTGQAVVVDIHADKPAIKLWLEGCGFAFQRSFERMYLKHNPHPGIVESQYLISGPELG